MTAAREEETLDPKYWGATRALGQRMMEDALAYLEACASVRVDADSRQRARLSRRRGAAVPDGPTPPEALYDTFRQHILPHHGQHPSTLLGWVIGTGSARGAGGFLRRP